MFPEVLKKMNSIEVNSQKANTLTIIPQNGSDPSKN
jgi:hypothetical protein